MNLYHGIDQNDRKFVDFGDTPKTDSNKKVEKEKAVENWLIPLEFFKEQQTVVV